ncbi:hypothetical protein A2U01_0000008 [Trifolium medium]|uniref:Uncharacterized protein n=1 Tax=Trifolium medium TaxID=97028 RepID=A0A392LW23_9FABA|nr:hypothetical protein [Trifolium medium]
MHSRCGTKSLTSKCDFPHPMVDPTPGSTLVPPPNHSSDTTIGVGSGGSSRVTMGTMLSWIFHKRGRHYTLTQNPKCDFPHPMVDPTLGSTPVPPPNHGSDTTVGVGSGGSSGVTMGTMLSWIFHKRGRHHTLTQNPKVQGDDTDI